jgi:cellulose synthase/poly-beta-1,6-N-acetylglucosamine synthase-like glycosyltransferase
MEVEAQVTARWVFFLCGACLFYVYIGYPAALYVLARLLPKPVRKAPWIAQCSVVIAAHNEASRLPGKIASVLASSAAAQIAEILVASDGSDDDTAKAVRGIADDRVRVVEFPNRRGKAAVLNDVVPQCRADVVVLTDARQEIAPGALGELLANFADSRVGVVSGKLVFEGGDATAASKGIGFYWRYEKTIRRNESRFGSVPGATGALYAIRRELFRPIHADSLLDDVAIPMTIVMQGSRCVFEERAVVFDRPSSSVERENIRKRRTIAGSAQLVRLYPGWLLPWRNPIWFQYVSHKLGRLLSPFFLAGILVADSMLFRDPLYAIALAAQVVFYGLALVGWLFSIRWCGVATVFVSLNLTTLRALADAAVGRFEVRWERVSRDGDC